MNYRLISPLLLLLLLASCSSESKGTPSGAKKDTTQQPAIILSKNTAMRIDPYIFSAKIRILNRGEQISVMEKSAMKSWIGNTNDFWYKIRDKDGISGWVFAQNIRILTGKNDQEATNFLNKYWAEQYDEIKKELTGKWWSYNQFGDFTDHGLVFHADGTYKSYKKGGEKWAIEGNYNLDLKNSTIVFLKGTTFGQTITYEQTGTSSVLEKEMEDQVLRMKKIVGQSETESEKGLQPNAN